jgi:predicted Zn-dependent peptidase
VTLTGLAENFEKGIALFEHLLADAQPNEQALENLIQDVLKRREDSKLSKSTILWRAMYSYGIYGRQSPFTNILSEEELYSLDARELVEIIRSLNQYEHRILYYGTMNKDELSTTLLNYHEIPYTFTPPPAEERFTEADIQTNKVFVVDYDMTQVEIIMLSRSETYNPGNIPAISLFNEYFGSGMSSVVFQELREAKGLAYSAFARYSIPSRPERSHYVSLFIGTQNDKLAEAMGGMTDLINNMPESQRSFRTAQEAIGERIRTERITKTSVLFNYERARRMGHNHDTRRDVFAQVPEMQLTDLKAFQQKYLKDNHYHILILGKQDELDISTLEEYGEVEFLTLEEIFGY